MPELPDLCAAAVGAAGGDELVEAYAAETRGVEVKARDGRVDSLSSSETRGVGIRVVAEGRLGYAWAADPTADEAAALVAAARESARHASPDEHNVLPAASTPKALSGLFREEQAALGPERKVALALDLERAAVSAHAEVPRIEDALYADAVSRMALASTTGLRAEYARTDCWCMVVALAERGEETQTGFSFAVARDLDALSWEEAATEAALRGARLLGGRKPGTERLPVVLDPWAAASLLGVVTRALSAEEVQKGRSLFAERVGEAVAGKLLGVVDDGRLPDGPASAPIDDEGVPTGRTPLIEGGVLRGFLHNTTTAHRAGSASTGNARRAGYRGVPGVAPTNLFVEAGDVAAEDLLAGVDRGVLVQDVTGVHSGANPVSGELSVGATGLRVEGGALGEPLREMTIASTMVDLLRSVTAVGSNLRFFPGAGAVGTPTLLIGEMTVGGA